MQTWTAGDSAHGNLFLKQCGWQDCLPSHKFGPAVRDHYLVHYVAFGKGFFRTQDKEYVVEKGQCFMIYPDQITTYQADEQTPWHYRWVGYDGADAEILTAQAGFTRSNPIVTCLEGDKVLAIMTDMYQDASQLRLGALAALGDLYRFFALVAQGEKVLVPDERQNTYQKAMWFMHGNYDRDITVREVASFVGLSRSQLFRVFKDITGESPKRGLTAIRMHRARMLCENTDLFAEEIASSVGISSAARLGVQFKEMFGMTLTACRKRVKVE